ncbi:ALF repeat-containing protein [Corynebacterium bovis]|nr:ALF repeat-containing protein [Corynebacterium bovis]
MAGRHADDAAAAAEASRKNIDLAERVGEVAGAVARDRLDAEGAFLRDRALAARAAQDARDAAAEETARRRDDLAARMAVLDGAGANADPGSAEVRGAVVAAAQVGGPAVAGAARVALEGGTADDLRGFVRVSYPEAVAADNATRVRNLWATDPDDAVRAAADRMADAGPDEVAEFLATTVPELRLPGLRARAWALREGRGSGGHPGRGRRVADEHGPGPRGLRHRGRVRTGTSGGSDPGGVRTRRQRRPGGEGRRPGGGRR